MALTRDQNYYRWQKGDIASLSANFTTLEFACHCFNPGCKDQLISVELIEKLQQTRDKLGHPVKITSGYRCQAYQDQLTAQGYETAKGISQHTLGNASDLTAQDVQALGQELKARFKAIGEAKTWFHVDTRSDKPRYWTYTKR